MEQRCAYHCVAGGVVVTVMVVMLLLLMLLTVDKVVLIAGDVGAVIAGQQIYVIDGVHERRS